MKINHDCMAMLDELDHIYSYVHQRHKKSDNCVWCELVRLRRIQNDFQFRLSHCGETVTHLSLWSLGTSLKDTPTNRKILLRWWGLFRMRMNRSKTWSPVFRVVEAGRRHLIHMHFVDIGYIDHSEVLKVWRSLTGEKSNVHVSGSGYGKDSSKLVKYLCKYLTKQTTRYAFMGPFRAIKGILEDMEVKDRDEVLHYGGVCYGGFSSFVIERPDDHTQLLLTEDNSETIPRR